MEDSFCNNWDTEDMEDRPERMHFQKQWKLWFDIFKIYENVGFY